MKTFAKCMVLLLAMMLLAAIVPTSMATGQTETILSDLQLSTTSPAYGNGLTAAQNLIIQTALSYFYKGDAVQYGSYALTSGKRNAGQIVQQTNNRSPEVASSQNMHYTVCSAYPHDVYYNALEYHVINHIDMPTWLSRLKQTIDKDYTEYAPQELDGVIALGSTTLYMAEYAYEMRKAGRTDLVPYLYSNMTEEGGEAYHDPQYTDGTAAEMTNQEIQTVIDNLQPGDILVVYRYGDDDAGHAMMAMGKTTYKGKERQYILHSAGYNYSTAKNDYTLVDGQQISGYDRVEAPPAWYNRAISLNVEGTKNVGGYDYVLDNGGSIRLDVAQDLLGEKQSYDINDKFSFFTVIRPLARENVQAQAVTHDGLARLQYPALEITKTASVEPYHSLRPGEKITFTVELANRTDLGIYVKPTTYSDLWVEETIPAGTSCPEAVDGVVSWKNVKVAPGATVTLTYTVTVDDTVTLGQTIASPSGKVGGNACLDGWFETAPFTYSVEGVRPQGINKDMQITGKYDGDTAIADAVYASAGYIGIDLPQVQELMDALCTTKRVKNENTSTRTKIMLRDPSTLKGEAATWAKMIIPGYIGGTALRTEDAAGLRTNTNRLRQLSEDFLQPGDILVYADVETNTKTVSDRKVYVYLGNSSFAVCEEGVYSVLYAPIQTYVNGGIPYEKSLDRTTNYTYKYAYSEVLTKAFQKDFFVCLRPSLAYEELPGSDMSSSNAEYASDEHGVLFNRDKTVLLRAPQTLSGGYRIPDSVQTVASGAFTNCGQLTVLSIPATLLSVEENAWVGGESLQTVCFRGEEAAWSQVVIGSGNEALQQKLCYGYILGDINEDANVDDADAMYLLRYTLFPSRYPIAQSGDVDGSATVDDADALYLLRHTLFPSRYPLKQSDKE